MARSKYRKLEKFPRYEITKSGEVRQDKVVVETFDNGKHINLKKDGVIYVRKVADLIAAAFPKEE